MIDRKKIQHILALQYLALKIVQTRINEDEAFQYAQESDPYSFINKRRIEKIIREDELEKQIVIERIQTLKSRI